MKVLALIFLVSIAVVFAADNGILKSYFDGRSGDIIINSANLENKVDVQIQFSGEVSHKTIGDIEINNYIAQTLGLPVKSYHQINKNVNLFSRPLSNLMVVVESSAEEISDAPSWSVLNGHSPYSSISSSIANILTGSTPNEHGIVADQWISKHFINNNEINVEYSAYIDEDNEDASFPQLAQIQDVVSMINENNDEESTSTSGRKGFVISASSSLLLSKALGVRPQLQRTEKSGVASLLWDSRISTFVNAINGRVSTKNPLSAISSYSEAVSIVKRYLPNVDLSNVNDKLIAELSAMIQIVDSVKSSPLPSEGQLDFLSIGVHSISFIKSTYGVDSKDYKQAISLFNSVMEVVLSELIKVYGESSFSYQIIYLNKKSSSPSSQLVQQVYNHAQQYVQSKVQFEKYFPVIYLSHETQEKQVLCDALTKLNLEVLCPSNSRATIKVSQHKRNEMAPGDTPSNVTAPTTPPGVPSSDDVYMMHVVLWSSILMAVVTAAIIFTFCNMDVGEDSLLYRQTAIPTRHLKST